MGDDAFPASPFNVQTYQSTRKRPIELLQTACGIAIGITGFAVICLALRFTARLGLSHQRSAAQFLLLAIGFFALSELVDGLRGLLPSVASRAPWLVVLVGEGAEISVIACAGLAAYFFYRSARLEVMPLRRSADTDALTGLVNHGTLKKVLRLRFSEAGERITPLSCAMIDVDDFKAYNDRYGHEAGNEVLRRVARAVQECVRAEDCAARYGGEEFVVLCAAGPQETAGLAERIRSKVERACSPGAPASPTGHRVLRRVTVSTGVASLTDRMKSPEELVDAADRAMYRSKAAGKNTVTIARTYGWEREPVLYGITQARGRGSATSEPDPGG